MRQDGAGLHELQRAVKSFGWYSLVVGDWLSLGSSVITWLCSKCLAIYNKLTTLKVYDALVHRLEQRIHFLNAFFS